MNNKADIRTFVIPLIIAVLVLFIVLWFMYGSGNTLLVKLGILVPSFNDTKPIARDIQVFRYQILDNNIKYYDGEEWLDFKEELELSDKRISKSEFINNFNEYYYSSPRSKEKTIQLKNPVKGEINSLVGSSFRTGDVEILAILRSPQKIKNAVTSNEKTLKERGDVSALIVPLEDKIITNSPELVLDTNNNLRLIIAKESTLQGIEFETKEISKDSEIYKSIAPKIISWRDEIYKSPIPLSYQEVLSQDIVGPPAKIIIYSCAEKIESYLIIDLSKPKTQEEQCPS